MIMLLILQLTVVNAITIHPAFSTTTPTLQVEPSTYTVSKLQPDEVFKVNVTINSLSSDSEAVFVQFRLQYNSSLLEPVDVAEGPFLNGSAWAPQGTFFVSYVEDDPVYKSNVLVGDMILPNAIGDWSAFPSGNGTIATITFKAIFEPIEPDPAASCILKLVDTKIFDQTAAQIPSNAVNGYYEVDPLEYPTLLVEPSTYDALKIGELFQVNVNINNLDTRWHTVFVQFRLQYNSSLLEPVDVAEGPFLNGSAWAPQGTFFVSFIEDDPIFKSNVLVGDMILPNAIGDWSAFPSGNGTIATITFKAIAQPTIEPDQPASSALGLIDTKIFDDEAVGFQHQSVSALYEIEPMKYPIISATYKPLKPSVGEPTVFDASGSYDPLYTIASYTWTFGDGTNATTTSPITAHVYSQLGQYAATLKVTNTYGLTNITTMTVNVGIYTPIDISIDVGSIQFKGETAEFNILTTETGKPVNPTRLEAKLYFNGQLLQDLTNYVRTVSEGLSRTSYNIPTTAQAGTYTLMVTAEYYDVKGAGIKSFQISPTLTTWDDQITEIKNGIATVTDGIRTLTLNLTQVNATITGLITNSKGEILAAISTTAGTLTTTLNTINATITEVNGNTVTMSTTLGNIKTELDGTVTTMLYVATILSAIAVILALAILMYVRKK
jgi:hypothetical protein